MTELKLYKLSDRDVQHLFRFGDQIAITILPTTVATGASERNLPLLLKTRKTNAQYAPKNEQLNTSGGPLRFMGTCLAVEGGDARGKRVVLI
jgi:hypothetical protein